MVCHRKRRILVGDFLSGLKYSIKIDDIIIRFKIFGSVKLQKMESPKFSVEYLRIFGNESIILFVGRTVSRVQQNVT